MLFELSTYSPIYLLMSTVSDSIFAQTRVTDRVDEIIKEYNAMYYEVWRTM